MAGLYIHIPFCKKKCSYCDFYSTSHELNEPLFVERLKHELSIRKRFLPDPSIGTIYFGGGTPSLLSPKGMQEILGAIANELNVEPSPEITLEANPDDLSHEYLSQIHSIGVNRLSVGVQSFSDSDLKFLGRRHSSEQAMDAVRTAAKVGFSNIGIDLIYGLPSSTIEGWKANLIAAFKLPIQHLSCYHLTFEKGTPLYTLCRKGLTLPVDDQRSQDEYQVLCSMAAEHGFMQYEVSNFAREGFQSTHNSSYWKQIPYLGLGPSAHSYNGMVRAWNPSSVQQWAKALDGDHPYIETEELTTSDKLNEYLMSSLRTVWGADTEYIHREFGAKSAINFGTIAKRYIAQGLMQQQEHSVRITQHALFVSDGIIADFFV